MPVERHDSRHDFVYLVPDGKQLYLGDQLGCFVGSAQYFSVVEDVGHHTRAPRFTGCVCTEQFKHVQSVLFVWFRIGLLCDPGSNAERFDQTACGAFGGLHRTQKSQMAHVELGTDIHCSHRVNECPNGGASIHDPRDRAACKPGVCVTEWTAGSCLSVAG